MLFSKNIKLRRRRKRGKNHLEIISRHLAKAAKALTKLYKKLLAILLYAYGAVEKQQGSKVVV